METYTVTVDDCGTIRWCQNDQLHRLDGPAVEWAGGVKSWYIEDVEYTEEQFNEKVNQRPCAGKKVTVDGIEYTLA